jgi:hypothetical protein
MSRRSESVATTLAAVQNASLAVWVNAILATPIVTTWLGTNIPSTNHKIVSLPERAGAG